ncbi:family 43 glycosylhydrolase [Solitalea sp. MAHUQ-68]|uniref:Family 43 glycosylhydrolase n=1 Tax=Solitalea agri TaxID=2953739 RepID=A0A9X2EZT1_9SPHI|nr:family 43 glycosylhydrolase [Solitalea agri]MCO4292067.1 family 43 glycosylhydrolase [Solitalea agri]
MKIIKYLIVVVCYLVSYQAQSQSFSTACNPMDLNYRFCLDMPSRREAADPTIVRFKDTYFLFASKSGGYWHSKDLKQWSFVETADLPLEDYAPTAVAIKDTLYFLASSLEKSTIYKSADPLSGKWTVACEKLETPVWDPALFLDDDQHLYLYWGCSNVTPIHGVELDYKNNFKFIGKPVDLITANTAQHGWEVPGDYNTLTQQAPWIEGSWMNKHNGKYYLQYSGPGTEYKSYADGVFVSESPLGPFVAQAHNAFAYKPEGFAAGAGHGSTFADQYGNYWHIGTMTISVKHMFERRLGLFPAFFDAEGTLYASTGYGDYPYLIPQKKINSFEDIFPGWMLLSYNKKVNVSSAIDSLPARFMTDENIRTYWSATSGSANEYATIDLGEQYEVYALQLNFAEHNTKLLGRQKGTFNRYIVEYSTNGTDWTKLIDQSKNKTDNTHEYFQLPTKVSCRYLKIKNVQVPDGNFAISGFRVFGKGKGKAPGKADGLEAQRNSNDKRSVKLSWAKAPNATGYVISYGVDKKKLYQHYMVYSDTDLTINSLAVNQHYYFTIESFNETGRTKGEKITMLE